jgi:hypothetical protein
MVCDIDVDVTIVDPQVEKEIDEALIARKGF